ncbi:GDSL-type esterase/lipase family protein [Flammeovirga kamogawensis]|uniref:SGNH hydrolase-type esterase domain-containing protein n=1 Tax=Flammeovirga kamogawensis TaxID=373891 RepID=A0ABX8GSY7_9BACT|nr:GDSL-type esterase/lipase family protein [Flammeovirga kamogawensis]MBB6461500.1 lysophospholipase L1-like esterase [Flammeovirga kamogawensis]QWG06392.1 hypothetical protein KM029_13760 [Flammeovirga kamogawensis]TRX68221.1 hypothetical protein EO216_08775 [Flammeovirga kamogawensis]
MSQNWKLNNYIQPFQKKGLRLVKGILTILLLCAHSAPTSVSNVKRPFVTYDFIRMDLNKINTFGDSTVLNSFYDKLKKLEKTKKGQVHILHLGDSHIQADFFSGWVRERFYEDQRFPMASRGFFFPYTAAKTNNPYNFRVSKIGEWKGQRASVSYHKSDWGIAAITAQTTESFASLTINVGVDSLHPYRGNKVEIYYPVSDSTQFLPVVQPLNPAKLIATKRGKRKLTYIFDKPISKFRIGLEKRSLNQREFTLKGLAVLDSESAGVTYSSSGVNGAKVTSYLRCKDLEEDILEINPDLIIISLGTNDAFFSPFSKERFVSRYTKLIKELRSGNAKLPIIITTPGDNFRQSKYINRDNAKATEAIFTLAKQEHLAVWDFYHIMGGLSSIERWSAMSMTSRDRVHLSRIGYQYQGELFYRALLSTYNN